MVYSIDENNRTCCRNCLRNVNRYQITVLCKMNVWISIKHNTWHNFSRFAYGLGVSRLYVLMGWWNITDTWVIGAVIKRLPACDLRTHKVNTGFPSCLYMWDIHFIHMYNSLIIFLSCDQAALWMVQSVRPSVCLYVCLSACLSVCDAFFTMFPSSYRHEIFRSYYQWQKWRPCKRSRSEVKGQGHRGQNPT